MRRRRIPQRHLIVRTAQIELDPLGGHSVEDEDGFMVLPRRGLSGRSRNMRDFARGDANVACECHNGRMLGHDRVLRVMT
jgi:hypothetical protein